MPIRDPTIDDRLSQIQTNWTEVFCANDIASTITTQAQRELLLRYAGAVHRYLLSAVHDSNVADDLAQEFAFRIIRGDFRGADPHRGRFRDFIKRALINLVNDHFRRRKKQPQALEPQFEVASGRPNDEHAEQFDDSWRREILNRTWAALDHADRETQTCYAIVLRLRATHPDANSEELAKLASVALGRDVNAAGVRQTIHRARGRFSELLRKEVGRTLGTMHSDEIDEELGELKLLKYQN